MAESAPAPPATQSTSPNGDAWGGLRLAILLGVLGIAAVAAVIEWQSREASQQAFEALEKLMLDKSYEHKIITQADVHRTLGRTPDSGPDVIPGRPDQAVEVYHWRRGLPIWSYTVRVYYNRSVTGEGDLRFSTAIANDDLNIPRVDDHLPRPLDDRRDSPPVPAAPGPARQGEAEPAGESTPMANPTSVHDE
jgi:hypothetical protein